METVVACVRVACSHGFWWWQLCYMDWNHSSDCMVSMIENRSIRLNAAHTPNSRYSKLAAEVCFGRWSLISPGLGRSTVYLGHFSLSFFRAVCSHLATFQLLC